MTAAKGGCVSAMLAIAGACSPPPYLVVTVEDPDGWAAGATTLAGSPDLDRLETGDIARLAFPTTITIVGTRDGERPVWIEARAGEVPVARGFGIGRFVVEGASTTRVILHAACDGGAPDGVAS